MTDQIQNHQGSWVKAEDAQRSADQSAALQKRVDELTAENAQLRAELEAVRSAVQSH
jgi:cell division protein FtsB